MNLLATILSLSGGILFFQKIFSLPFGASFIFYCSSITVSLFFSALLANDILFLSRALFFLGIAIFFLIPIKIHLVEIRESIFEKIKNYLSFYLLNPDLICFWLLCCLIYFGTVGAYFSTWDEFTHWGLVAKEIFVRNNVYNASDTFDIGFAYVPGTALFQYFIHKNIESHNFNEYLIYFAQVILVLIPIFILNDAINFFQLFGSKFSKLLLEALSKTVVAIVYLQLIGKYNFPFALMVDVILAVSFAFLLIYIQFYANQKNQTHSSLSLLFISTSFLTLVKDMGFFLSLLAIPLLWLKYFSNFRQFFKFDFWVSKKLELKKDFLLSFTILVAAFITKLLWAIRVSKSLDINNTFVPQEHSLDVKYKIFELYEKKWLLLFDSKQFEILFIALFLTVIFCFINFSKTEKKSDNFLLILIYLIVIYTLYSLSLLYMYLTRFEEVEALVLASFERYESTIILSISLFLLFDFFKQFNMIIEVKKNFLIGLYNNKITKVIINTILVLSIFTSSFFIYKFFKKDFPKYFDKDLEKCCITYFIEPINRKKIVEEAKILKNYLVEGKKVYIIYNDFLYPECYILNYELPKLLGIHEFRRCINHVKEIYLGNLSGGSVEKMKFHAGENDLNSKILTNIKNNYDLVYIIRPTESMWKNIGYLFSGNYKKHNVFILNKKTNKLIPANKV